MTKSELIEALAQRANLTQKRAEDVINTIFNSMTQAMINGERIEIRGLGSFVIKNYKPYVGRNPKTGEEKKSGNRNSLCQGIRRIQSPQTNRIRK